IKTEVLPRRDVAITRRIKASSNLDHVGNKNQVHDGLFFPDRLTRQQNREVSLRAREFREYELRLPTPREQEEGQRKQSGSTMSHRIAPSVKSSWKKTQTGLPPIVVRGWARCQGATGTLSPDAPQRGQVVIESSAACLPDRSWDRPGGNLDPVA